MIKDAEYWADWLVDAVGMATQNRMLLRGDKSEDKALTEAIYLNGLKAIKSAMATTKDTTTESAPKAKGDRFYSQLSNQDEPMGYVTKPATSLDSALVIEGFELSSGDSWVKCMNGGVPKIKVERHPTEEKYRILVYCGDAD